MSSIVYSEENIQTLNDAAHIRLRPQMYIGNTHAAGLHHLLRELFANSLDEVKAGFGNHVGVTLFADGSCAVSDHGRGIPVHIDATVKQPVIIAALTVCGYSPKQYEQVYRTLLGLHFVGLKVVAALSEWGEVETFHGGEHHHVEFEKGAITVGPTHLGSSNGRTGTVVRFKPDPEIFGDHTFDLRTILHTLCELAFLHAGVRFTFTDERTGKTDTFHFPDGTAAFVKYLNTGRETLHEPIRINGKEVGIGVEVALQYTATFDTRERGYVNAHHAFLGGTHISGFRRGLRETFRRFVKGHGDWPDELPVMPEDIREGVTAVISLEHSEPQWDQVRGKLESEDAERAVAKIVREGLSEYLTKHSELGLRLCQQIARNAEARIAAREALRRQRASRLGIAGATD